MQALILVGGTGSRLGDLVENVPKPCLEVAGKPFLFHLLDQLVEGGISEVILLAGYRADVVKKHFVTGNVVDDRLKLKILVEDGPQGTGGALLNATPLLQDSFLLLNGDSYFNFDLKGFLAEGQRQPPGNCYMALKRVEDGSRYGEVVLTGGLVTRFSEKVHGAKNVLINTGIYWCHKSILQWLPHGHSSLEQDLFPKLVAMKKLSAAEYTGDFIDIGIPSDFHRADAFIHKIKTG